MPLPFGLSACFCLSRSSAAASTGARWGQSGLGCGLVGNLSGLLLHQFPAKGAGEDAFFKAIKEGKGESRLSVG